MGCGCAEPRGSLHLGGPEHRFLLLLSLTAGGCGPLGAICSVLGPPVCPGCSCLDTQVNVSSVLVTCPVWVSVPRLGAARERRKDGHRASRTARLGAGGAVLLLPAARISACLLGAAQGKGLISLRRRPRELLTSRSLSAHNHQRFTNTQNGLSRRALPALFGLGHFGNK